MAVISSTSGELIALSSLLPFDIYKVYVKPAAPSNQLVTVSHYGIGLYTLVLAVFCCILNAVNVDLTWLITVDGIIIGGAANPLTMVLLWDRMSSIATIASPWIGLCFGMIAWFTTSAKRSGTISVTTTGDVTNALAGNTANWAGSAVVAVVLSLVFPQRFTPVHQDDIARVNRHNRHSSRKCQPWPSECSRA